MAAAAILLIWLSGAFLLARQGFFLELSLFIPNVSLIFIPIVVGLTIISKSSQFRTFIDNIPQHWLIAIQFARVMGVTFLILYAAGLMPAEFAIPAGVGDILIGITAPLVGLLIFLKKSYAKIIAVAWNIIGFGELSLSIVLGFFTSPTPYQLLALDNANDLLFAFPLALVPVFAVPLSLLLHIFSLRVLLKR